MKVGMKKKIQLFLLGVVCLFFAQFTVEAKELEYEGFLYHYEGSYLYQSWASSVSVGKEAVITGYVGNEKEVIIPKQIEGVTVTTIEDGCFKRNFYIETVVIPDTVTHMGRGVFFRCKNLKEVSLPYIEKLPESTFAFCTSLKSITIPDGCAEIDKYAFYKCTSLDTVVRGELDKANTLLWMHSICESAFEGCRNLKNIDLSKAYFIDEAAFKDCKSLKSVNIYYANDISARAFYKCVSLEKVDIDTSCIGEKAFYGCKKLKTIRGYNSLDSISKDAFKKIHPKAVFTVPKKYVKSWKKCLTAKVGFKKTMKIKTKKKMEW